MVEAAAVVGEVCRCWNNWGWVVLFCGVVVGCVKDVVEDVLLHLPDLGVTIDPSLVNKVRHCVEVGCFSDCVSYDNDLCSSTETNPNGTLPSPSFVGRHTSQFQEKTDKITLTSPSSFFPPESRSSLMLSSPPSSMISFGFFPEKNRSLVRAKAQFK